MSQKILIILCVIGSLGLVGLLFWSEGKSVPQSTPINTPVIPTLRMEGGVQIIHVFARAGYEPNVIEAKAGIPTRLEVETKGTYDCSAVFTIPSLQYRKMLPPTGVTVVDIPVQKPGGQVHALCAMGMYTLDMNFN